ncbi:MAG: hypothetical protein KC621_04535 [Myxococcales bacterium]|nr:hypothetical protein [Myxococcales bacterium]
MAAGCAPRMHLTEIHAADVALSEVATLEIRADGPEAEQVGAAVREWLLHVHGPVVVDADGDVVLSLAGFHADEAVVVDVRSEVDEEGASRQVYAATRTAYLEGSFVLTDRAGAEVDRLDETGTADVWTEDAATPQGAVDALGALEDAEANLARAAGFAWARRITSSTTAVVRPWYAHGDPRMSEAALHARLGDWDGAITRWREVSVDPLVDDGVRATALYDLGVAWEAHGQHRRAWLTLVDAAALDPRPRIEHYRDTLDVLRAERRPLQQRMVLPAEAPPLGSDG